jgi:hypothetical protein
VAPYQRLEIALRGLPDCRRLSVMGKFKKRHKGRTQTI